MAKKLVGTITKKPAQLHVSKMPAPKIKAISMSKTGQISRMKVAMNSFKKAGK